MIYRPRSANEWVTLAVGAGLALLLGASVLGTCGCAAAEKLLTAQNVGRLREATRETCRELAEADRLAGAVLDDAGVAP